MTNSTLSDIMSSVTAMQKLTTDLELVAGAFVPDSTEQLQGEFFDFLSNRGVPKNIAQELSVTAIDSVKGMHSVDDEDAAMLAKRCWPRAASASSEPMDIIKSYRYEINKLLNILCDEAKDAGRELDDIVVVSDRDPIGSERLSANELAKVTRA